MIRFSFAQYNPASANIDIWLFGFAGQTRVIGKPLEYTERQESERQPPTISFDEERAQALMDALWSAGIRPVEGRGSAGQLEAVQRHLEDMRAFAFGETKKPCNT